MSVTHLHIHEKPSQSIIYVDPAMARRVLSKNTHNRPLTELHIRRLMDEMKSGRWKYNGEAIKWSSNDVLLDGQHRLTALSRMPDDFPAIPFLVVRGLSPDSQDTMDQGRKRSAGDQLNLDGLTRDADSKVVAGAIRVYIEWRDGLLFTNRNANQITNTAVIEWAHTHTVEMSIMKAVLNTEMRRVKARPSITLAVLLQFHLIDGEAAREFCDGLYTGAGLAAGNPILTLRDRLDRIREQGIKTSDRDYIAFFVVAWNAWRQDRKLSKFQRPAGGSWTRDSFPEAV